MLIVKDLSVCVGDKEIVHGVDLKVGGGELHVIMGPNGSGKSTLLLAIMGFRRVRVCSGAIVLDGVDITDKPSYERAKLGIALAHQNPPSIRGVRLAEVVKNLIRMYRCSEYTVMSKILRVDELLVRDLYVGFSGGEKKRVELYLVLLQNPKLALLDEPDSGVDVESLNLIAAAINYLIRKGTSVVLVTHTGTILSKLSRVDLIHVMIDGRVVYRGLPDVVIPTILKYGFRKGVEVLSSR